MRLVVTTPTEVVFDAADIASVRAEDESGTFGILPGHADLLAALVPSVLQWRQDGRERYCAVRGGVLTVSGGRQVSVATREAVMGDDLARLEHETVQSFKRQHEEEATARSGTSRLQLAALRQILAYVHPERASRRFVVGSDDRPIGEPEPRR